MKNSAENPHILSPTLALDPATNFQSLKKIGLAKIIESGSEYWTDYNEHDPGITILEVLTFALTDLSYRSNFPIADLLTLADGKTRRDQFYQAREIFSVNPLTILDFRKLLIDIDGVANADLSSRLSKQYPFSGIWDIYIRPDEEIQKQQEKKVLRESIRNVLDSRRNLSEDWGKIIIQEAKPLAIKIGIQLKDVLDAEEIIATILQAINYSFLLPAKFLSLEESFQANGGKVEKVFDGPALQHGFISSDELTNFQQEIQAVEIVHKLVGISGLDRIEYLFFENKDGSKTEKKDKLSNTLPGLQNYYYKLAPLEELSIQVWKNNTPYEINEQRLSFSFSQLLAEKKSAKLVAANRNLPIPTGRFRDPKLYSSIQHDFPSIYRLERKLSSKDKASTQNAEIKQLKAYLLFFDQIMANYLAQLSQVSALFSWSEKIDHSYFSQGLGHTVKELAMLLLGYSGNAGLEENKDLINQFYKEIQALWESPSEFVERRGKFLDHLLARYGRDITAYLKTFSKLEKEESLEQFIKLRENILGNYPELSANRAKGFYAGNKFEGIKDNAGLKNWVKSLMDIPVESLEDIFFLQRFSSGHFDPEYPDKYELCDFIISSSDGSPIRIEKLLKASASKENFQFDALDKKSYRILIQSKDFQTQFSLFKTYQSPDAALAAIDELFQLLNRFDKESENLYLIEHILLRPEAKEAVFGLSLCGENSGELLSSKAVSSLLSIQALLKASTEVPPSITILLPNQKEDSPPQKGVWMQFEVYEQEKSSDYGVKLKLQFKKIYLELASPQIFKELAGAKSQAEKWQKFIQAAYQKQKEPDIWQIFSKAWESDKLPPAYQNIARNPYNNVVSVLLPNWPLRFQQPGFRMLLEQSLYQEAPSNVFLNILYLDFYEFQQLRDTYGKWWNAYSNKEADAYCFRVELVEMIASKSFRNLS